jgi:hypothetical protein
MILLSSHGTRRKMELSKTSADRTNTVDNDVINKNEQTTQVGNQTSNDKKANEQSLGEKFTAHGPETLDKENPTVIEPTTRLTSNYFCFECGSVFTTLEDKKQHELIEIERKKQIDLDKSD